MLERWFDDLSERLLTHYVGGAWRAPLGVQMRPVAGQGDQVLGQVVCATRADIARAKVLTHPPDGLAQQRLMAALHPIAPHLAAALAQRQPQPPDAQVLLDIAHDFSALGRVFHMVPDSRECAIYLVPPHQALLGVAFGRLAQSAGLPSGTLALLHAPHEDQIKRDP